MGLEPRDLENTDFERGTSTSFQFMWHYQGLLMQSELYLKPFLAGFLDILSQLTEVGDITRQAFEGSLSRACVMDTIALKI